MARTPTSKLDFTDEMISEIPFVPADAGPSVTPRYYDTNLPQLMLRVSKTEKSFFLTHTDPVSKKPVRDLIARWGEPFENKTTKGTIKVRPITIEQVRQRGREKLAGIVKLINDGHSPELVRREKAQADAAKLRKGMTLRQAWQEYLQIRTRSTIETNIHVRQTFAHLEDVMDKPLVDWCSPGWLGKRMVVISTRSSEFGHRGTPGVAVKVAEYLRMIINVVDADHSLLGENPASIALSRFKSTPTFEKKKRKKSIIPVTDLFELHEALTRLATNNDWLAHDFISLLLYTGIRENAASMLCWRDINFDAGYCWLYFDTNLDKQVILPLSDRVLEILKARHQRLSEHEDWERIKTSGWLFPVKYTYVKKINKNITPQGKQVGIQDNSNPWSYVKETKRFFDRLDMPTNVRLTLQDEWRQPVLDAEGRTQYVTLPDNPDAYIYKIATAHDFRRMVATYSKNYAGIAADYVEKLLTHRSETLLEGYIVDENDHMINELRDCFNQLADFIDAGKTASIDKIEKLISKKRLTKSALAGGRVPTVPVVRNKHTPKSKPSYRTTSHP